MAAEAKKGFDPSKSRRAQYLNSLSDKDLFNRYLIPVNKTTWFEDMLEELNKFKPNTEGEAVYPLSISLQGNNLDYIISALNLKIPAKFMPNGYKLNSKAILTDVEAILAENTKATHQSSLEKNATLFVVQLSEYVVQLISGRCLSYSFENGMTV